ncbi:thiol reductant ABC exporter subunit CydD [Castellaniella caeni]
MAEDAARLAVPATIPEDDGGSPRQGQPARWLASRWRQAPWHMGWALAAPLFTGLLLAIQTWLLANLLTLGITARPAPTATWPAIVGIFTLILVRALVDYSGRLAASQAAERIKRQLREALFARLLAAGPQWSRQRASGELASVMVDEVERLDGFLARYLPSAVAAVCLPLAFIGALFPIDWIVGAVLLLSVPLIPLFMALVGWGAQAANRRHQQQMIRLSGLFADRLRGAFTLKLFGRAQAEVEVVRRASNTLSQQTLGVLRIAFLSSAVLEFFAALGVAAVALYIGLNYLGYLDLRSTPLGLQAGLFMLFMVPEIYGPLRRFAANYHDRATAVAAVEQIDALYEGLPEPRVGAALPRTRQETLPQHPAPSPVLAPQVIKVRGLVVHARGRPQPILDHLSLDIQQGESVAIMGPSGAGKTTLLESLAGLRQPDSGRISTLGMVVQGQAHPALGHRIALLGQHPYFSKGTIADNLRLVCPSASDTALARSLAQACADSFVRACPQGIHTELGERGLGLSGGQLHRLALARVFLLDAELLLLDEPVAHLDQANRQQIVTNLLEYGRNRTLLIATHDPQVAARMDRIIILNRHGAIDANH